MILQNNIGPACPIFEVGHAHPTVSLRFIYIIKFSVGALTSQPRYRILDKQRKASIKLNSKGFAFLACRISAF